MNKLVLALLVATMVSLPVAVTAAPENSSVLLAQRGEGSPNTRSGGDSSDELRAFYQKEMTALKKEIAAMRQEMTAMRNEMMAMKGGAMSGGAMKGDAMKGDAMKGDAMKGDSMMKKP